MYRVTHEGAHMSEATFTFRVDEALKNDFASAAKARDRTGAQLLRDFMRAFVQQQAQAAEHDAWFREQVQIGIDAANAGEVLSADEVEAEAQAWQAETRRKMAAP
jgi:predicted transcriptional regulator